MLEELFAPFSLAAHYRGHTESTAHATVCAAVRPQLREQVAQVVRRRVTVQVLAQARFATLVAAARQLSRCRDA